MTIGIYNLNTQKKFNIKIINRRNITELKKREEYNKNVFISHL